MPLPWFRFYSETMRDPKMQYIARATGHEKALVVGAWAMLLSLASDSPVRGALFMRADAPLGIDNMAEQLDMDTKTLLGLLDQFQAFGMLHLEDGAYHLTNWDKRQPNSDNSTERVQRFRERRETPPADQCNGSETVSKRPGNAVEDRVEITDLSSSSTPGALETFLNARGGAVGPLDVDRITAMAEKAEDHRQALARASPSLPGADLDGDRWVACAVEEAVLSQDGRGISLKYIQAILDRWIAQGFKSKPPGAGRGKGKKHDGSNRTRAGTEPNQATPATTAAVAKWLAANPAGPGGQQ